MRTSIEILAALVLCLGLVAGCNKPMEATCTSSEQCSGNGLCLKGVCSGYSCEEDGDCRGELVCGSVLDVLSCVRECDSDDDCGGTQTCTSVKESMEEDAASHDYCL